MPTARLSPVRVLGSPPLELTEVTGFMEMVLPNARGSRLPSEPPRAPLDRRTARTHIA